MKAADAALLAQRFDAARLAYSLLRLEEPMASLMRTCASEAGRVLGVDVYSFTPSWQAIPRAEIVPFLVSLPSPALMAPTTTRGVVALTLLHELAGERRRFAEKVLANFTAGLDDFALRLGLDPNANVLLELEDDIEVYPLSTLRLWTQQFGIFQIGWWLSPLSGSARAEAQLIICRSDGQWFPSPANTDPARGDHR